MYFQAFILAEFPEAIVTKEFLQFCHKHLRLYRPICSSFLLLNIFYFKGMLLSALYPGALMLFVIWQ